MDLTSRSMALIGRHPLAFALLCAASMATGLALARLFPALPYGITARLGECLFAYWWLRYAADQPALGRPRTRRLADDPYLRLLRVRPVSFMLFMALTPVLSLVAAVVSGVLASQLDLTLGFPTALSGALAHLIIGFTIAPFSLMLPAAANARFWSPKRSVEAMRGLNIQLVLGVFFAGWLLSLLSRWLLMPLLALMSPGLREPMILLAASLTGYLFVAIAMGAVAMIFRQVTGGRG